MAWRSNRLNNQNHSSPVDSEASSHVGLPQCVKWIVTVWIAQWVTSRVLGLSSMNFGQDPTGHSSFFLLYQHERN